MLQPIEYVDKGTDYSASDFNKPNYQLWISKRIDSYKNTVDTDNVFNASFVGSLIHQNSEGVNEINVIKEFSTIKNLNGKTIGGTMDRLEFDNKNNSIVIGDIKTGGHFPMLQKYKKKEYKEWSTQLSVYYWLIKDMFINVETFGRIYAFVLGYQKNKDNMPDKWTAVVHLNDNIEKLMLEKINIAESDIEPKKDCESWRCNYCDYSTYCKTRGVKSKEFS